MTLDHRTESRAKKERTTCHLCLVLRSGQTVFQLNRSTAFLRLTGRTNPTDPIERKNPSNHESMGLVGYFFNGIKFLEYF